jgi:Ni,Fe-hydrogenase I large subunit
LRSASSIVHKKSHNPSFGEIEINVGALAKSIIWQIAGNVNVMAGAHMEGILLVKTDLTFVTGSSLFGRVLARTACNLQIATITEPPRGQLCAHRTV